MDLPDEIILLIMQSYTPKDSILFGARLKILSPHFNRIWRSIPCLIFDSELFLKFRATHSRCKKLFFTPLVDQILNEHDNSDVHTLFVDVGSLGVLKPEWVSFALSHNVRTLELYGCIRHFPATYLNYQSLVTLVLCSDSYVICSWDDGIFIPNLEKLVLVRVSFDEELWDRVRANMGQERKHPKELYTFGASLSTWFPKLKDFQVYHCQFGGVGEFRCIHPVLKTFKLAFNHDQDFVRVVIDLPLAEVLVILSTEKRDDRWFHNGETVVSSRAGSFICILDGTLERVDKLRYTDEQFYGEVVEMAKTLILGARKQHISYSFSKVIIVL